MRTFLRGKVTLLFMMLGLLLAIPAIAYADNLIDSLDGNATSDPSASQTIAAGDSTSTGFTNDYWIVATGGCDVGTASDTVTSTFSWPSTGAGSLPAGVSVSTNSITFDECAAGSDKNQQSVKFTSTQVGTYTIPAPTKSSGTGTYITNAASFTLVVNDNCPDGDNSGDLQDGSCAAPVTNHAPTVSDNAGNVSGGEGSELTNSGAFSDEDTNDTLTITKLSGAGEVTPGTTRGAWSWSHTPDDNGTGTVEVQVSDGHSGTAVDSFTWTANNVAPTVTDVSASVQNALVNKNVTFTGTATDPSGADRTAGFFWQFSKDGTTYNPATIPNPFASNSHEFTTSFDSCGTKSVKAKATDKDGGTSDAVSSGNVNVYNASFSPPVDIAPYVNTVQKGRVIPVKISVGCASNLTGLSPSIQLLTGDQSAGNESTADEIETYSVSSADTTGVMRAADGGYIYNLRVPDVANATYTIRVNAFGGSNASSNMYAVLKTRSK
jgi:hypothetical protein